MTRATPPDRLAAYGRLALVTGASDGIGRETALALAERGFDLALVARDAARLRTLAETVGSRFSVEARIIAADLATDDGQAAVLDLIASTRPGIAVLAAGFGSAGDFADLDPDEEAAMLTVNCGAVLRQTHALIQGMRTRGAGQIVLFGSLVGFQGCARSANYAATKAYVQTLAEGLAVELAPHGIKVLSVAPGPVASGFARRAGMRMSATSSSREVARGIIRALGSSGTIRPGFLSKVLGLSLATAPRVLRVKIMSGIMTGMASRRPSIGIEPGPTTR